MDIQIKDFELTSRLTLDETLNCFDDFMKSIYFQSHPINTTGGEFKTNLFSVNFKYGEIVYGRFATYLISLCKYVEEDGGVIDTVSLDLPLLLPEKVSKDIFDPSYSDIGAHVKIQMNIDEISEDIMGPFHLKFFSPANTLMQYENSLDTKAYFSWRRAVLNKFHTFVPYFEAITGNTMYTGGKSQSEVKKRYIK